MKKSTLLFLLVCMTFMASGQVTDNQKMVELGKTYKDFLFSNHPTKEDLKDIKLDVPQNLTIATEFIIQTITTKNKILTTPYLSKPNDVVLKQLYIIEAISQNLRQENQVDNAKLVDSLLSKDISIYELVDTYYGMLFTAAANKNQPFDLSKIDFKLKEYNLKDDTEKGILVLRCMDYCGMSIWGFMNVVNPPNTSRAYSNIKKFPKINGRPYYQYTDFYFTDFEMNIIKDKGLQSYKSYYLNKFYETLLYHLICINKEGGAEKEKYDLLLGSILKEKNLYKYTKYKETLESIFQELQKN